MPYYQFLVPEGGATLRHKAAVATAVTEAHVAVTGAPAGYVNCAFIAVGTDTVFVGGRAVDTARLVGLIRPGRTPEVKRELLLRLGAAWAGVTGEPLTDYAIWLHEVPGRQTMENGEILPEPWETGL
ncbi:MAG: tautomerase family protein [Thermoleophilia bacterium]